MLARFKEEKKVSSQVHAVIRVSWACAICCYLPQDLIRVVDAFNTPRFKYNHVRKIMTSVESTRPLHGEASDKANHSAVSLLIPHALGLGGQAEMLRERYQIIQQLLARNEKFAPPPVQKGPASR